MKSGICVAKVAYMMVLSNWNHFYSIPRHQKHINRHQSWYLSIKLAIWYFFHDRDRRKWAWSRSAPRPNFFACIQKKFDYIHPQLLTCKFIDVCKHLQINCHNWPDYYWSKTIKILSSFKYLIKEPIKTDILF